ncbi:hypothetical protein SLNWT_3526 [Streptomyces albus]|uniref:NlpC/P60 domain-containing protein n=1 Tax=Streptomyces albus (strain ATCC 21838 / DSM 41398 / FERM P-419 / JCM 4703 / NBRC 107858) TaxID=1081613 RepID=A0A0B5F0R9_STRA4|nr:hypothetical protein SLNWT_3526 [Streptomyces albus]
MRNDGGTSHGHGTLRRRLTRKVLPALAAGGITVAGLSGLSAAAGAAEPGHAAVDVQDRAAGTTARSAADVRQGAAGTEFPTWGTGWVVHAEADAGSAAVGTLNKTAPGADRITADYQVDTGRKLCEGSACSTYMAHLTAPVEGFLSVVAVDIPQDSLPGVPVKGGETPPQQPGGTRAEALQRAATWLTANNGAQVPYSQTDFWTDGYRQDCSGYVSMALDLGAPGPNTVGLTSPEITTPIAVADLRPGDLLIDADGDSNTRHVVMFEKWDDEAHTSYTAYEQRGGHGTDHRSLTYGLNDTVFTPYRPLKYTD